MSRLDILRKNLLQMTPDERRECVNLIRADRRLVKERPVVAKQRRASSATAKRSVDKMLAKLSDAQRDAFFKELGDAEGDTSS